LFVLVIAASGVAASAQSDCTALNTATGEGKFTGQISTVPDGSSMTVTYGNQSVLVHYSSSVTVCQGGQPASVDALTQGASVSVFGPERRNGNDMEIDAARIFVAGRPRTNAQQTPRPNTQQTPPPNSQQAPPPTPRQTQPQYAQQTQQPNIPPTPPPQQTQQRATGEHAVPNSVILGGGTQAEAIARLHVVRKYALSDLRSNPQVTLGAARLDFRPMLNNTKELFNITQRLHAIPQHVQMLEEGSDASEVDQGLVIHHVLSYRILPGKCGDANAKAQLDQAGIGCFTRATTSERVAEFSTAGSPRYVADPQKRQQAVAAYQRNSPLIQADATKHIADLRKALADPTQRAAIAAQVGQAETTRMSSLNDDQLEEELINTATQRFEEMMFVPKGQSTNNLHPQQTLSIAASPGEIAATQQLLRQGVPQGGASPSQFPKLLKIVPPVELHPAGSPAPAADQTADTTFGPYIFLTGFTFGQDYEWHWSAETTVNWCVVGCSSTYGVYLHAAFSYGIGLRFPIQTQLKYHTVVHPNHSAQASVTATYTPIKGSIDDFLQSGIAANQVFNGQEIVAQVVADAGYSVNLPGFSPSHDDGFNANLANDLPPPYTGGFFTPPAPGAPPLNCPNVVDSADLLLGLLDFGVVGAEVFPAVNIGLFSNRLQFTLDDETQNRQTNVASSGQTVPVDVTSRTGGTTQSHFSFGNPVYNLEFSVTPGLDLHLFVDVGVWSDSWDPTLWFPQVTVDLPPNGIDFGCHAGTTCLLDFQNVYNPSTGQVNNVSEEEATADRILTQSGCQQVNHQEGNYLCPVKGMLGLCQAMLKNGAVTSCAPLVPSVVDEILKRGHCTGSNAAYACPKDMMGLCGDYLKNQEILSCKQTK
jgi:hypothetical protein